MNKTIRRMLSVQESQQRAGALAEGAATLVYDFYANPNAISNNLGWCKHCHAASVHESTCVLCKRTFERTPSNG